MTRNMKQKFRMSAVWKKFRQKIRRLVCCDYITRHPLTRSWNLHHLDMRDCNYTDISRMERFMPLNEGTHEFIHWLYRLWVKDASVLRRIETVLGLMYEYTHDNKKEGCNDNRDTTKGK